MNLLSFDGSTTAQTAAITLVTVAAVALFALIAAHWTWQWLAPQVESRGQPTANVTSHATSANALFGKVDQDQGNSSPTGIRIRLLGIVAAATGQRGYAVVRLEPRTILTVREGDEVAPGLRLAEVAADHVILERGDTRETLGWPPRTSSAEPPALRIGK
jgi:general secretion pathway protein C